jgi:hypothetical protein
MIMDLEELKSLHPAIYKGAQAEGAQRERSRAVAHLTMGERSGDLKTALASIRNGADLTIEIQAHYMAAGMNRAAVRLHQEESDEATAILEDAKRPAGTHVDQHGEAVFARLQELVGDTEADA